MCEKCPGHPDYDAALVASVVDVAPTDCVGRIGTDYVHKVEFEHDGFEEPLAKIVVGEMTNVDDVIIYFAAEMESIVANGTRGDYTWSGLLSDFLRKVDQVRPPRPPIGYGSVRRRYNQFSD